MQLNRAGLCRPAMVHGFVLEVFNEAAYREAWFVETGQPLPASIDFCVSSYRQLCTAPDT